jgi:hypothetical protein
MSTMFGGRKKRVERLRGGAKAHLEDGESIREVVPTQTGQSAAANASAVGSSGTGVLAILLSVEPEDVGRLRETERGGSDRWPATSTACWRPSTPR